MKIICLALVCLLFRSTALADMTVVQSLKSDLMPGAKQDSTMTMAVKGQKARIDLPGSEMSSIIDAKSGKMYTLMHKEKQVMVISLEDLKKSAALATGTRDKSKTEINKTGRTETIQGYKCSEYDFVGGGDNPPRIHCWITEEVDDSEMEFVRSFGGQMGGLLGFNEAQKPKGMVIRSESKMNINGREVSSASEVKSISRSPLADSLFAIPQDYKVLELPVFNPQAGAPPAQ
ncbi:MAG: DUF4412 domain-containing protein [Kiritimatiellia bacterium]